MNFEIILDIIYVVVTALAVGIPALIKLISSSKKLKSAKTEAEEAAAREDMKNQMMIFCQAAEVAYEEVNKVLKSQGSSAGPIKKDSVQTKLFNYAAEKGYTYDSEYWSNEIDTFVAATRNVN